MAYALLRAARTFCRETWLLRRSQTFNTEQGKQQYLVVPPPNEECIALKHAQITSLPPSQNISPLRFVYPTAVNPNIGQQRPYGICFVPYQNIALVPPPDNTYSVTVELITQPVIGTQYIPDELGTMWDQALGYGALEFIFRTSQSDPWYNPQMAGDQLRLFNGEIVRCRGAAAFDFTPNQRNLIGRNFAGRR